MVDECEGCGRLLREDEGTETEDMVMLCDDCWAGCLNDLACHSEECECGKMPTVKEVDMSEQTQNRISDERLAELVRLNCVATHWPDFQCHICERRELAERLTDLRARNKRLVEALEEIERHHLELNRAKGRPANHSHTLRLCAAALATTRKLEGK